MPSGSATWFRAVQGILFAAGHIADFNKVVGTIHRIAREPLAEDREAATNQAGALSIAKWELCLIGMYEMANGLGARLTELKPRIFDTGRAWIAISDHFGQKYVEADYWKAHLATNEALTILDRLGDPHLTVLARILHGASLVDLGAYGEGEGVLRDVMDVCARSSISAAWGDAKRWLAHALEGLGRVDEALKLQTEAEAGAGALIYRGSARAARGYLLACMGKPDEGADAIRASLDLVAFAPSHHSQALGWLARAEVMRGRPDVALEIASRAQRTVDAMGSIGAGESIIWMGMVEAHEALGDRAGARAAREKARARIHARAERIHDPKYRRTYLENVPENGWLLRGPC